MKRSNRKRVVRTSILAANVLVLSIVLGVVLRTRPASDSAVRRSAAVVASPDSVSASALDQISSADIAVNVARATQLPESTAVTNQADSVNAQLSFTEADSTVVSKPQVVAAGLKSRKDIQKYIVKAGDTVPSLAAKFGITSETIKSSNALTSDTLKEGQELVISPVNGVIYRVKPGDTVDGIASKYGANKDLIIAFNDTEISGLPMNQYIVIPDGRLQTVTASAGVPSVGLRLFGGGGYDAGWCTAYASAKAGVPGGWGNANTWHIYAPLYGWTVSTVPRVGAVAQTSAGWAGHVGIVEAVSEDGSMIKYSDMNGLAGFNRVGYSDWVPTLGKYQRFIYH